MAHVIDPNAKTDKVTIANRFPLLKAFISPTKDTDQWIHAISLPYGEIDKQLILKFSKNYELVGMIPLLLVTNAVGIFNPNSSLQLKLNVISAICFIGFELGVEGNDTYIELFLQDIVLTLQESDFLNNNFFADPKHSEILVNMCWGMLKTGVAWRLGHISQ